MAESNMNSIVFLDYIHKDSGSVSVWFESSTVRAWGFRNTKQEEQRYEWNKRQKQQY